MICHKCSSGCDHSELKHTSIARQTALEESTVCLCVCVRMCVCVCPCGHVCGVTKAKVIWHKHTHSHTREQPCLALCWQAFRHLLLPRLLLFDSFLHPWSARLIPKLYPHLKTGTSRKPAGPHCILKHSHTTPCTHQSHAHAVCSCERRGRHRRAQRGVKHCGGSSSRTNICLFFFPPWP